MRKLLLPCLLLQSLHLTLSAFNSSEFGQFLAEQDGARVAYLTDTKSAKKAAKQFKTARDRFYRTAVAPIESACKVMKHMGGVWVECGGIDGQKSVCMDHLFKDLNRKNCLVYSFGISDDWSFEDAMGDLGCRVRAFDPTIDAPEKRSEMVSFYKVGIALADGMIKMGETMYEVKTLSTFREEFGEENQPISYLKLDVEGWEIEALEKWADDDTLADVAQMQIEIHLEGGTYALQKWTYAQLTRALSRLYTRFGLAVADYAPNLCQEKEEEPDKMYHNYFDILLVKTDKGNDSKKKRKTKKEGKDEL